MSFRLRCYTEPATVQDRGPCSASCHLQDRSSGKLGKALGMRLLQDTVWLLPACNTHLPCMTPSGLSIGTTLNTKLLLRAWAVGWSLTSNWRTPAFRTSFVSSPYVISHVEMWSKDSLSPASSPGSFPLSSHRRTEGTRLV